MTTATKPWYESNGIKGSIATIGTSIGVLVGMFTGHVAFDPVVLGANLATLAGGALSLYGRITASAPVSLRGQHDRTSPGG